MFLLTGTEQNTYLSHFLFGRKLSATANAEICASRLCLHQVEYDKSCQLQVEAICKIWIEAAHFDCCTRQQYFSLLEEIPRIWYRHYISCILNLYKQIQLNNCSYVCNFPHINASILQTVEQATQFKSSRIFVAHIQTRPQLLILFQRSDLLSSGNYYTSHQKMLDRG